MTILACLVAEIPGGPLVPNFSISININDMCTLSNESTMQPIFENFFLATIRQIS